MTLEQLVWGLLGAIGLVTVLGLVIGIGERMTRK